ncbi:hypothetical protein P168DRAFT_285960 [Aspergillus campestris IBT 28561]|uniref:Uncharacterized protein n=1 Tax=Aspergillus campestris (strain IBT 28561) TaxID=1392248 RepID=A0A2I1DD23_ASPC2|nr:uncharacterized protein P168DRAFT_285960 [Aspergillus campestris IBT 28561]PKY07761.1 hypothetical protein P168DRAFT_285960 [Aspergillus campestris IBT 28561]
MLVSSSKKLALMGAMMLGLGQGAWGLWDCILDQHVFPVDTNKFVVHFTSLRDSHFPADGPVRPWVRCSTISHLHRLIAPVLDGWNSC